LEELIGQLLLLAKSDDRQLVASRQPIEVGPLLEDIRATTVASPIDVHITATADAVTMGNPEHLSRMVRNIVDNAVHCAAHRVLITATATADSIRIEIGDDGPGIPVGERERVFDRFVRLDASRERVSGSSGLGLAIAKEIATAHGGRIAITGAPGSGALVVITLPRAIDSLVPQTPQ
jgi:signal transduction histidine kinase